MSLFPSSELNGEEGVDDSEHAREAARVAVHFGHRLAARLVLVHVVEDEPVPGAASVPGGRERTAAVRQSRAVGLLAGAVVELGLGTEVRRRVAFGAAADAVAGVAADEGAELVVVGSRGRGSLASALLGSVSSAARRRLALPRARRTVWLLGARPGLTGR